MLFVSHACQRAQVHIRGVRVRKHFLVLGERRNSGKRRSLITFSVREHINLASQPFFSSLPKKTLSAFTSLKKGSESFRSAYFLPFQRSLSSLRKLLLFAAKKLGILNQILFREKINGTWLDWWFPHKIDQSWCLNSSKRKFQKLSVTKPFPIFSYVATLETKWMESNLLQNCFRFGMRIPFFIVTLPFDKKIFLAKEWEGQIVNNRGKIIY